METVLFVAGDAREFAGLQRRVPELRRLDWPLDYAASLADGARRWILTANGMGPALAREAVREAGQRVLLDRMVSTGFCGALDPALRPSEVFIAREVLVPDTGGRFDATPPPGASRRAGVMLSGDRVIQTAAEKAYLRRATGASAVDMESHAVAEAARHRGSPFHCVRVVSDTAAESFALDFNSARGPSGRLSTPKLAWSALRQPTVCVPELIRLARRCARAADELGAFLADCRF
jgi:adenosylhomocysteine nucleosidase